MYRINTFIKRQPKFIKAVSGDDYHNIYFRGDINRNNILMLTRMIQEQNNKYVNKKQKILEKNPINLHITSYGGDSEMGLMAYDIIKQSRFPIYTFCEGYVCSAGTFLFLAGQQRFMTQNSVLLIHQLSSKCDGTHSNMVDQMYNNNLVMKNIEKLYLKETKLNKISLNTLLRKDIYLTADECLESEFITKII